VQSVIKRFPNFCVLRGGTHSRIREFNWSLLKVREGNYKRGHNGSMWKPEAERVCFSPPGAFKTYAEL
jgi:hypothetical protein